MSEIDPSGTPMMPDTSLYTLEQQDTAEVVDELFEYSDMMAHNVMHAIHGEMMGQKWAKDEQTGMWHKIADAPQVEVQASVVEASTGVAPTIGATALAEAVAEPINLDAERARRRPVSSGGPGFSAGVVKAAR